MDVGQVTRGLARQTAAFDRSKLDVMTGARCALAIAIPLVVGLAIGHPGGGAYVAAGALLAAFSNFQPGYRRRAAIMVTVAVWLAAATLVGGLVGGWTWVVVLLAGLSACGAGLLVALGPNAAMVATLGTAEFVIASSQPVGTTTALVHAAQIGVGGLLATLVLAGPWPRRPLGPERRALAAAYRNLAGYVADIPLGRTVLPDPGPIEDVRATLALASRHARWGRGRAIQSLADEAVRVRESLGALAAARGQLVSHRTRKALTTPGPSDSAVDRSRVGADELDEAVGALDAVACSAAALLDHLASSIGDDTPPGSLTALHDVIAEAVATLGRLGTPDPGAGVSSESRDDVAQADRDLDLVRSLHGQLRSVQRIVTAGVLTTKDRTATSVMAGPSSATLVRNDMELLRANLSLQSTAFRHALRLCVAAIVATLLYRTLPGTHDYWIVIGTLMVLKPDFGTTVTRGVAAAVGTVTGAVLATLIAAELRPGPVALAILVSVLAVVVFTVYQTNYGLYAVGLTAMAVFFAAFGGLPPLTAATDRTVDNLIGIALAFALFFCWPTWAAREVPRQLARLLTTQTSFARLALDGYIDPASLDQRALDQAASDARLDRTNAEAAVERMVNEPERRGLVTTEVADGIVAGAHRFGLAAVALRTGEGTRHRPMPELAALRDGITTTMASLAAALGGEPMAPMTPMPDLRRLHTQLRAQLAPPGMVNGSAPVPDDRVVVMGESDFLVDAVNTIARLVSSLRISG